MPYLPERLDARNPGEALDRHLTFMQWSVNCLDPKAVWRVGPPPAKYAAELPDEARTLVLANAPVEVPRKSADPLYFAPTQYIEVVPDDRVERREFRVTTHGYIYLLSLHPRLETSVLEWHYHPYAGRPDTHLHIGSVEGEPGPLVNAHVPTGRVSFESIMRFLITEFGVEHPHEGWKEILAECEQRFRRHRTWT